MSLVVKAPAHPVTIEVDPLRIREVLVNLVSNAVRHTGAGGVITVDLSESGEGVSVAVRDTGTGMTPEDVARMFDRFYKGSESRGSGLGLAIARGIIAAHGGDITASSEIGKGTTVRFVLTRPAAMPA